MKPYKLKHIPTGLYYQPRKSSGNQLSKKGKIYQGATHGLSAEFRSATRHNILDSYLVHLTCTENSPVVRQTKYILVWTKGNYYNTVKTTTYLKDWVIEEI